MGKNNLKVKLTQKEIYCTTALIKRATSKEMDYNELSYLVSACEKMRKVYNDSIEE